VFAAEIVSVTVSAPAAAEPKQTKTEDWQLPRLAEQTPVINSMPRFIILPLQGMSGTVS